MSGANKTALLALVIAIGAHLPAGCASAPAEKNSSSLSDDGSGPASALDLGEDWAAAATARDGEPGSIDRRSSFWTIVLGTYTGPNHEQAAANMVQSCTTLDPRLAAARVHTTSKGSMVIYGTFESPESPDAQQALEMVKSIERANRPVFARALLSRINPRYQRGEFRPNELMSVRQQYPNVDPLYTLQIAVWGDFGSGTMSLAEIRRRAEQQVRRLRAEGYDAYFHHDEDRKLSLVTIGLFDHRAIDPASSLYSPDVERLLRQFPEHLVNGEPLRVPIDPERPRAGTRIQKPQLVVVPEV
jgi:hypothetical protein